MISRSEYMKIGIDSEKKVIEAIKKEFPNRFKISHRKSRGVDITLDDGTLTLEIEVKSCQAKINYKHQNGTHYDKDGHFVFMAHQIKTNYHYAFVINDKKSTQIFFLSGYEIFEYFLNKNSNALYQMLSIKQLKSLHPKRKLTYYINRIKEKGF